MSIAAIVTGGYGLFARTESIAKGGFSNYVGLPEPPASGYQYTLLAEPSGGWSNQSIPFGQTPAVVSNDILISPLVSSGGYTVAMATSGIAVIDAHGDTSRQLFVAVDIYDVSLLTLYGAATFAVNNVAPQAELPNDEFAITRNVAISAGDLAALFFDAESDPLTFAVTSGDRPAGTSVDASGQWAGIPTALSAGEFVLTATDTYGDTGTFTVIWSVAEPEVIVIPAGLLLNRPAVLLRQFLLGEP